MKVTVSFYPDAPRGFPIEQEVTLNNTKYYKLLDILKLIVEKSGNNLDLIEQGQSGTVYIFLGDRLITDFEAVEVTDGSKVSIVLPVGGGEFQNNALHIPGMIWFPKLSSLVAQCPSGSYYAKWTV